MGQGGVLGGTRAFCSGLRGIYHSPYSVKPGFVEPSPSRSLVRPGVAGCLRLPQLHWPKPETKQGAQHDSREATPVLPAAHCTGLGAGAGFPMAGSHGMAFLAPQSSAVTGQFDSVWRGGSVTPQHRPAPQSPSMPASLHHTPAITELLLAQELLRGLALCDSHCQEPLGCTEESNEAALSREDLTPWPPKLYEDRTVSRLWGRTNTLRMSPS